MGDKCFVAINIVSRLNTIENTNSWPIIFYWDGESDVIADMKADEKFMNLINSKCLNESEYDHAKISMIYINNISELQYKTVEIPIQEFIPLETIDLLFPYKYVIPIFEDLYEKVYHETYPLLSDDSYEQIKETIQNIYTLIKNGINRPIQETTVINYIASTLGEQTKLSTENRKFLTNKISEIIKESL